VPQSNVADVGPFYSISNSEACCSAKTVLGYDSGSVVAITPYFASLSASQNEPAYQSIWISRLPSDLFQPAVLGDRQIAGLRDGHKELSAIATPQFTGLSPRFEGLLNYFLPASLVDFGVSLPTIYVNSSRLCLGKST